MRDLYLVTKKLAGKFSSRQTSQWWTRTGTHWQQPTNSWNNGQNTSGSCWTVPPWLTTRHPIHRDRTAHQLWQTLKGRDQEGHHDPEEWEGCRTRWDTSRSHQSRHRDSRPDAIQPLQQDLGEGGGTSPVERRNHQQAAKKKVTLGTAATIEGSCSCQRQASFSTGFYWRGWRRLSTPSSKTSRKASGGTDPVPTRSPMCASSWNSNWSGTPPSTSIS